jgi:hypothetical protein
MLLTHHLRASRDHHVTDTPSKSITWRPCYWHTIWDHHVATMLLTHHLRASCGHHVTDTSSESITWPSCYWHTIWEQYHVVTIILTSHVTAITHAERLTYILRPCISGYLRMTVIQQSAFNRALPRRINHEHPGLKKQRVDRHYYR